MVHTPLNRPRPEARNFSPLLHTYRSVLMPGERPIRLRRLVKQEGSNGSCACPQNGGSDGSNAPLDREGRFKRLHAVNANPSVVGRKAHKCRLQLGDAKLQSPLEEPRPIGCKIIGLAFVHLRLR